MTNEAIIRAARALNGITEEAHTYAHWRALGYQVRKGEHAAFSTAIWKYAPGKGKGKGADEGDEGANEGGRMFLKNSHFFTRSQVDPTTAAAAGHAALTGAILEATLPAAR